MLFLNVSSFIVVQYKSAKLKEVSLIGMTQNLLTVLVLIAIVSSIWCKHVNSSCDPDFHPEDCPPWFSCEKHFNNTVNCDCIDNTLGGAIRCDQHALQSYLQVEYCMTYDNDSDITLVGSCPFEVKHKSLQQFYIPLPPTLQGLYNFCQPLNRDGPLCASCKQGYGPAVFSFDLRCYDCSKAYHGWWLFFGLEFSLSTLFFCIIISCRISATTASMNAFVLCSQIVVTCVAFNAPYYEQNLGNFSKSIVLLLQTVYGFWNLDFFRQIIPPFCVSDSITGSGAVALQYISAFYPICLIITTYVCIELHDRNFRVVVWLWAPFHKCLARFRRAYNAKNSIIDVFATFLLLSYLKLLFVSANLINSITVYTQNGTHGEITSTTALLLDPSVELFSQKHFPFAFIAIIMFSTFIALPPIFLLLYPTKAFQKCLSLSKQNWQVVHTFADAFQGCFKNGTEGTKDYRYFAGLYFIFRIMLFMTHSLISHTLIGWIIPGLLCVAASLSIAIFRPYKMNRFNILDCFLFNLFGVVSFIIASIPYITQTTTYKSLLTGSFIIVSSPLLYIVLYVIHIFLVRTSILKKCKNMLCIQEDTNSSESFPDRFLNPEEYSPFVTQVPSQSFQNKRIGSINSYTGASTEDTAMQSSRGSHTYGAIDV